MNHCSGGPTGALEPTTSSKGGQEGGEAAASSYEGRWCPAENDDLRELPIEEVSEEDDDM